MAPNSQNAVITVVGRDRVGIIAAVAGLLADVQVNIKDISQTILQDIFTMIMLVDIRSMTIGISIRVQHADIFDTMHRI